MKLIGEERSESLEIEPAKIWVTVTVRRKYAPIDGNDGKIKIAPMPKKLIPKSYCSASWQHTLLPQSLLMPYLFTDKKRFLKGFQENLHAKQWRDG